MMRCKNYTTHPPDLWTRAMPHPSWLPQSSRELLRLTTNKLGLVGVQVKR